MFADNGTARHRSGRRNLSHGLYGQPKSKTINDKDASHAASDITPRDDYCRGYAYGLR